MNLDDPLDFEFDDPLDRARAPPVTKRRKNLISLDDLVNDAYKQQRKVSKNESNATRKRKGYDSDGSDDHAEADAKLSQAVEECENQVKLISSVDENYMWGIPVFCNKNSSSSPCPAFSEPENCKLLQSFMRDELNSLVGVSANEGETFLEGLLVNGWLLKLVLTSGNVESPVTTWVLNLLLYSSKEEVTLSACDFWCTILSSRHTHHIDFPGYAELREALDNYGFISNLSTYSSSMSELAKAESNHGEPPHNIRAWIRLIAACCHMRSWHSIFSTSEAEELLVVVISLFLDRRLLGLSLTMYECLLAVTNYFSDEEWDESCEKVAKTLTCRIPGDLNCLRVVECIPGVNVRFKLLKRTISFEFLVKCLHSEVTDAEKILSQLTSINVNEQRCNLYMLYIYLVLAENWLMNDPLSRNTQRMCVKWDNFLRNCSKIRMISDLRSYAVKVRSKVSYLVSCPTTVQSLN